jgi:hypothetical protein
MIARVSGLFIITNSRAEIREQKPRRALQSYQHRKQACVSVERLHKLGSSFLLTKLYPVLRMSNVTFGDFLLNVQSESKPIAKCTD